jgi:hypothetical protein
MSPKARFLNLALALSPANDAFYALGPVGQELVDAGGTPVAGALEPVMDLYDAGTEASQAGAIGSDTIRRQLTPDAGADEGSGLIRLNDDPIWYYPPVADVIDVSLQLLPAAAP